MENTWLFKKLILLLITLYLSIPLSSFGQVDRNGNKWDIETLDTSINILNTYSTDEMLELVASRYKSQVDLYILAKQPHLFAKIVILRRKVQDNRYAQVKMLEPKDFKPEQRNQIIRTEDKYPEPGQTDVYYKIVAFTKSGAEFIFPSVYLKGFRSDESDTTKILERFVPVHDLN